MRAVGGAWCQWGMPVFRECGPYVVTWRVLSQRTGRCAPRPVVGCSQHQLFGRKQQTLWQVTDATTSTNGNCSRTTKSSFFRNYVSLTNKHLSWSLNDFPRRTSLGWQKSTSPFNIVVIVFLRHSRPSRRTFLSTPGNSILSAGVACTTVGSGRGVSAISTFSPLLTTASAVVTWSIACASATISSLSETAIVVVGLDVGVSISNSLSSNTFANSLSIKGIFIVVHISSTGNVSTFFTEVRSVSHWTLRSPALLLELSTAFRRLFGNVSFTGMRSASYWILLSSGLLRSLKR